MGDSDDNQPMSAPRDETRYGLLEPAFTAAHRALLRLDEADVPAALRPVRATTKKKTLPAPLRRVLAAKLEEAWLRELAVAELASGERPSERASQLFLTRPEGWEREIEALAAAQVERQERHDRDVLVAENRRLEEINRDLGQRLREAESRLRDLERESDSVRSLEELRTRLGESAAARRRLEAQRSQQAAELEQVRRELVEADERISVLRSRAARGAAVVHHAETGPRGFGRGRPAETARLLDELVETLRPDPDHVDEVVALPPLRLPAGIRPDADEAIEWIRTIERKVLLLVDGHNVAHDFEGEPGRTARDRIVSEAARLRRLSDGPLSVVVFFDSQNQPETHHNFGVTVRYVTDADAALEAAVAAADVDCIVISTDKDVRARTARHGALTLWGTALSGWISRR